VIDLVRKLFGLREAKPTLLRKEDEAVVNGKRGAAK
jgi:hypothetical protein